MDSQENKALNTGKFSRMALELDAQLETDRIVKQLQNAVGSTLRRRGAVLGISGGIDSAVCLALCVRAFGPERVVSLLLPEKESSPESASLALQLARTFGVEPLTEDISGALSGAGCYHRRDEAIKAIFPQYGLGWKAKIIIPGNLLGKNNLNVFSLVVISPDGEEMQQRLPPAQYAQIVAATNFKQRMRMSMLYYHAELRNFAVIGTAPKNERDLGFFVKYGDGGGDVFPIVHLFKSQVYQLAKYLDIPEEIQCRKPTTDTYSAGGSQEEFFFRVPYSVLDLIWLGWEEGVSQDKIASALGLTSEQVNWVIFDIQRKKKSTEHLRLPPIHFPAG
jgi:NAD+ synthase